MEATQTELLCLLQELVREIQQHPELYENRLVNKDYLAWKVCMSESTYSELEHKKLFPQRRVIRWDKNGLPSLVLWVKWEIDYYVEHGVCPPPPIDLSPDEFTEDN